MMASDINSVTVCGRLVRDAELQYTNSGMALCKISIAVNRSVKKNDQWQDEASFFDLNLWGKRGESLNVYLTKGQQIAISGELKQDRWEQDGQKRSRVVIDVKDIQLIGGKSDGQSGSQKNSNNDFRAKDSASGFEKYQPPNKNATPEIFQDDDLSDIPF